MSATKTLAMTGCTGFVGSATLEAALGAGHAVRALTRRDMPAREGVEWVRGTLSDEASLADLCKGSDAVIHIAALTNTPDPNDFEVANVTGTQAMIAAAKAAGVRRFVFVSSLSAREPKHFNMFSDTWDGACVEYIHGPPNTRPLVSG